MKASRVSAALLFGFVAASCGRDPLLPAVVSGEGGAPAATGGVPGAGGGGGGGGRPGTGGRDATPPVDLPPDAPITDVAPGVHPLVVLPATLVLPLGKATRLRALVTIGNDVRDLGSDPSLTWGSDNVAVAEVTTMAGRVTGRAPGMTRVRASHPFFVAGHATVTVTGATVTRVVVDPALVELRVGEKRTLIARATFNDGVTTDVTESAVWVAGDQRVARVQNSVLPIGEVTAVLAGEAIVSAEFAGMVGSAVVRVAANPMPTLAISPLMASQSVGSNARFTAALRQPGGAATDVSSTATWSVLGTGVATSTGGGLFRCQSQGTATVRAVHSNLTATATLSCMAGAVTIRELRIDPPANSPLPVRARIRLTVTAIRSDGTSTTLSSGQVAWRSSDPAVATVDASSNLTGHAAGMATITATAAGISTSETYTFIGP